MTEKKKKKTTVAKKPAAKKNPAKKVKAEKKAPAIPKEPTGFPIVGMGASAGGLEALEAFFTHMSPNKNIAFVIIQHLSPKHKSIMGALLSKCTEMDVLNMEDGMKVEPNRIYLNPPDKNVVIMNGTLQLMEPVRTAGINLPIDCFFKSMSEDLGEKAICVILSGTATDGTLGLRAVKGEGGMAMVQDPDSAKYDGMPRSAIATGLVDFILPVEKIPHALLEYISTPYISISQRVKPADDPFVNHIRKIFVLIRTATGHDFSHYKQTTLRRRIERRMAVHQIHQISDYVKYLQQTPAEVDVLFKDMLIGVTNFFRDPEAFHILEEQIMPALLKNRPRDAAIRIWSVGCSTGEEAYSLAILLSEAMEKIKHHLNIQIFASDIDPEAIDRARSGVYPNSIAADVSEERLRQYFIKEDNTFQVKKQVREMIVFAVHNLAKDPPFSKIDLLSCRNLLIYMDGELQKKVLPLCHYALNPQGILFLGPSESIGEFTNLFQSVSRKWKVFSRKEFFTEKALDYPGMPFYHGPRLEAVDEKSHPVALDLHQMAERMILDHFSPAGALVNDKYEIINFMGKTDKYLETPTGKASFNILKMAREGLKAKLGTALHNAARQKKATTYEALRIQYNGGFRIIDLTVSPLTETNLKENFMLVMFEDKTPPQKPDSKKRTKISKDDADPRVVSLEEELQSTKEHLQTTIEELETSNEELKSTNEELQSVNEEMQSTNEELETSKEELQSTNEELITVNTELQNKVDELSEANNDINNLLAATDIGTIFLDTQLCIKRYTPAMTKIFNLISTDVDRPIGDITAKIDHSDLAKDAEQVLDTLAQKEAELQTKDGAWYAMRIAPYRTIENVIDGVVITFVETSSLKESERLKTALKEQKRDEALLRESEERFRAVFEQTSESIVLIDAKTGALIEFNERAHKDLGYAHEEFKELKIFDFEADESSGGMAEHFKQVLDKGFEVFETKQKTRKGEILSTQISSKAIVIGGKKLIQSIWWRY